MHKSAYRSRSVFDDPQGRDTSYRTGSVVRGIYTGSITPSEVIMSGLNRGIKRRKWGGGQASSGKRARSSSFGRPRTLSSVYGRSSGSSSVSRFRGKSPRYRKRVSKFVRGRSGKRRVFKYGNRSRVQQSFLNKMLVKTNLKEQHLGFERISMLASVGNALQDKCQWLSINPCSPGAIDLGLAASSDQPDSTTTPAGFEALLKTGQLMFQVKNSCNHRADVTVYKLYPRINFPAAFSDMDGINPPFIQSAFSGRLLSSNAGARLPAYDEHGADIFMSELPKTMRIKKVARKYLEPGGFFTMKHTLRDKLFSKAKFGVMTTAGTISGSWDYVKVAPIYLIRAQGPMVHDESKTTIPLTSTLEAQTVHGSTMGGFAVSVYARSDWHWMGPGWQANAARIGVITAALPTIASVANEKTWEVRVPQEDQPGV